MDSCTLNRPLIGNCMMIFFSFFPFFKEMRQDASPCSSAVLIEDGGRCPAAFGRLDAHFAEKGKGVRCGRECVFPVYESAPALTLLNRTIGQTSDPSE